MTRECLVAQLRRVSDVELVGDCNRKFNPERHYLQANVFVKSKNSTKVMEFSLTRSGHVRSSDMNGLTQATVSMYFKPPPHGMLLEAWRILRTAAEPCTLFPDKVEEWYNEVVQGGHALAPQ